MKTRKRNTQLVQTRVTKETERKLIRNAEAAGLSIAAYVRVLVTRDAKESERGEDDGI